VERNVECRRNYAELLRERVFIGVYGLYTVFLDASRLCLGRPRRRWGYNIRAAGMKQDGGVDLSEDRRQQISLLNTATKLRVPSKVEEFWIRRPTVIFLRGTLGEVLFK
jgi:hypothetical protein